MNDKNDNNRGVFLELLYSIGANEASIFHDVESLQFIEADIKEKENVVKTLKGEVDETDNNFVALKNEINALIIEKKTVKDVIKKKVDSRRSKMRLLRELCDQYNKRHHCTLKHWVRDVEQMVEVVNGVKSLEHYKQAYEIMKTDFEILAICVSLYSGIKVSDCLRCIADSLK